MDGARADKKIIHLSQPSIMNGSQTQGELRRFFEKAGGSPETVPNIKFEIIVTDDDDLIAEISIARNFQNDVRAISIAGRRGQRDELEAAVQRKFPDARLRKSETDLVADGQYLDTEKIIQLQLLGNCTKSGNHAGASKVRASAQSSGKMVQSLKCDGVVFPILAAHSAFVCKSVTRWKTINRLHYRIAS